MGAPAMIYEHRTYTVAHGLMDEYLLRYETHGSIGGVFCH